MSSVGAAQYVAKTIDNIVALDDDLVWTNSEVYSMLRDIQEELASDVRPADGITLVPEEARLAREWYTRLPMGVIVDDVALAKKLEALE